MGRQKPGKPRRARVPQPELDAVASLYTCPSGCAAEVQAHQAGNEVRMQVRHEDGCATLAEFEDRVNRRKQGLQNTLRNLKTVAGETGAAVIVTADTTDDGEPWATADRIPLT